jgi:hypothetical protein
MSTMYIGPDLKGIAHRNQVYTYHPVEVIERACGVNPLARHLFVGMDNIVEAKKELRRPGSFLHITYKKIEQTRR